MIGVVGFTWAATLGFAQEINVTSTGVGVGAVGSTASGALIQQSGQDTSFVTKDGVNPAETRMIIKGDGKVGIGTTTPSEKLTVAGNSVTTGSATVGSLVVGTSTILTQGFFESTEQSVADNATLIMEHGLDGIPRFATVSLRCKVSQYGWSVGDEILLSSIHMRSDNYGITTAVNTTQIKARRHGPIWIHKADTSGLGALDWSCWRLVFRAWR